jgi:hypothetical protein
VVKFCRLFWGSESHNVESCPNCRAAWAQVVAEDKAMAEVGWPLFVRNETDTAALDCHGSP